MSYAPRLCFAPAGMDGCGYWRMWLPHLKIPNSAFMFTEGYPQLDEMAESDAVVVQRLMLRQNASFLQVIRAHGLRIIYDLDDNLWALPKSNPAHRLFADPEIVRGLEACAEWADVVTVSTEPLKRIVEKEWRHLRNVASKKPIPVMVVENRLDPATVAPIGGAHKRLDGRVVVGWAGSNTHAGDLAVVWPALLNTLDRHPNVSLELVGHAPHPALRKFGSRVSVKPWSHISEYAARMALWNWDIILAPLESNRFNASKSAVKMIEAGALEVPCLASCVRPYEDFCAKKPELKWLLCVFDSQWETKLTRLVEDAEARAFYGKAMRENVVEHYDVAQSVPEWLRAACLAMGG